MGGWPLRSVLLAYAVALAIALAMPDALLRFAAKEGPLEGASHVVLAAAAVAWLARARRPPRWVALALAIVLALVLAEETDWGALVVDNGLARGVAQLTGRPRLHGQSSYLLFALPLTLWLVASRVPKWRVRLGPHAASHDVLVTATVIAVATLVSVGFPVEWERALEEIGEALFYALVLAAGLRRSG